MQFLVLLSLTFSLDYFHSSLSHFLLAVRWRLFLIILSAIGKVVRANLAALPHLSDKERVVIEKNHTAIYVTCLWK
jgi:hypothetical protein